MLGKSYGERNDSEMIMAGTDDVVDDSSDLIVTSAAAWVDRKLQNKSL